VFGPPICDIVAMIPPVFKHTHLQGLCPVAGQTNRWCPAQEGDSRSPCPALNTLANHGYLPRNGKDIGMRDMVHALKAGYHLSTFFAWFLTFVGYMVLQQFGRISLGDLARHNHIEHDASLVHRDAELEAVYAPCEVDDSLLEAFCSDAWTSGIGGAQMSAKDVGRARVRRENETPVPLNGVRGEIARGEMAIALGVFGGEHGCVPIKWFREWFKYERLPRGWKPTHTQGFRLTFKMSWAIRSAMKKINEEEDEEDDEVALSESISSSEDSFFTSGAAEETTPPTSDGEDRVSLKEKPDVGGED